MTEESKELKNDFFIKFQSFSQEIDQLKGKLQSYENTGEEVIKIGSDLNGDDNIANDIARKAAQLETSRDYRSKYNLDETADASRAAI